MALFLFGWTLYRRLRAVLRAAQFLADHDLQEQQTIPDGIGSFHFADFNRLVRHSDIRAVQGAADVVSGDARAPSGGVVGVSLGRILDVADRDSPTQFRDYHDTSIAHHIASSFRNDHSAALSNRTILWQFSISQTLKSTCLVLLLASLASAQGLPSMSTGTGIRTLSGGCGISGSPTNPIVGKTGILSRVPTVNVQSGASYAIRTGDCGKTVELTNTTPTPTIVAAGTAGYLTGWFTDIFCAGSGGCTLTPTTSTINGAATLVLTQYQSARILSDGTNYQALFLGGGSASGAGITVFSGATALTGTQYFPIGGGVLPSVTESQSNTFSPQTATVSNFYVNIGTAPGVGNTIVFTWRDTAASQALTCTITGAAATSCSDLTHSFKATLGDALDIQAVVTGTIAGTPIIVMSASFAGNGGGGSGPTVNQNIRTIGASFGSFQSGATALSGSQTACVPTYIAGTIQAVEIIGNVSGSATIDVQSVAHASWTGTASVSSITAADIPALSSAAAYSDTTLTGWTTSVTAGTDFCFVMTSPTTVAGLSITLKVAAN